VLARLSTLSSLVAAGVEMFSAVVVLVALEPAQD
jgi:hypothetical protein